MNLTRLRDRLLLLSYVLYAAMLLAGAIVVKRAVSPLPPESLWHPTLMAALLGAWVFVNRLGARTTPRPLVAAGFAASSLFGLLGGGLLVGWQVAVAATSTLVMVLNLVLGRGVGRPVAPVPPGSGSYTAPEALRRPRPCGRGVVYGTAGAHIADSAYEEGQRTAGQRGEEAVGAMLEKVVRERGGTVFHGLCFRPGHRGADVDHAMLVGNTLYLIDAKMWKYGNYRWRDGRVMRDGAPFAGGDVHMADAVRHWQAALGRKVRVTSLVVLAAPNSSRYRISNHAAPAGMNLHTLDSARRTLDDALRKADRSSEMVAAQVAYSLQ